MKTKKLITCLDVQDGILKKGVKFLNNLALGDPVEAAKRYNADGIDEIVMYDFSATNEGRGINLGLIERIAKAITVPFGVGGGIKTVEDCRAALNAGANKVHINSAAAKNPLVLAEAVAELGSGRIVYAMDADDEMLIYYNGGREKMELTAVEMALRAEGYGVCEIVVNAINTDGMRSGFQIPLTRAVASAVKIPVVASGGGGTVEHIYRVLTEGGAATALVASMLHFGEFTARGIKERLAEMGLEM
jgi:cyclase